MDGELVCGLYPEQLDRGRHRAIRYALEESAYNASAARATIVRARETCVCTCMCVSHASVCVCVCCMCACMSDRMTSELLLKDLVRATDAGHADMQNLSQAQNNMVAVAEWANEVRTLSHTLPRTCTHRHTRHTYAHSHLPPH